MSTKWLAGARRRDLSSFVTNGPFVNLLGVCLHVNDAEHGTPISFWGPDNGDSVTPNFQVWRDGRVDQMLPFDRQPWCQRDGNEHYAAIETEGRPSEPLTAAQIRSIGKILAIYHRDYGVPLQVANHPGERGLITHKAGGEAWGGHSCPGDIRSAQRGAILAAAASTGELKLDADVKARFDAIDREVADLKKTLVSAFSDSAGKPHYLRTWLSKVSGKTIDLKVAKK